MIDKSNSGSIFISILIPAYEYIDGVTHILKSLGDLSDDVEVLVFDDTDTDEICQVVENFKEKIRNIQYRHNPSFFGTALGAAENWNSLLDAAQGEYVILLHHDETPLNQNFISELRCLIKKNKWADVFMLDLILLDEQLVPINRHVPYWVRWLVCNYASGYLFRRNVIGPTATLVVRRVETPRFDAKLRWLIDVDYYIQLCHKPLKWKKAKKIQVGSLQRQAGTITAELKNQLSVIDLYERKILVKRYPENRIWLEKTYGVPFLTLELFFWYIFKSFYVFCIKTRLKLLRKI